MRTPLILGLLAVVAAPVRAEFCLMTHTSRQDNTPQVFELGGPYCAGGNILRFSRKYGPDRVSQNADQYVTDSWPGFMGADEKCQKAAKGAKAVVDKPGSIVLATTYASAPQVWAFKGSCYSFRSKLSAAWETLKAKEGKDATYKKAMELAGAGEDSMGSLVDQLIALAEKPAS